MSEKIQELQQQYMSNMHAVQSGVAAEQAADGPESAKHLRVGINSAMVEHAGIARLLIAKGIFTEEEYFQAMADSSKLEVERYEAHLSKKFGRPIKLG